MNKNILTAKTFSLLFLTLLFALFVSVPVSSELIIEQYSNGFFSGTSNANPEVCVCGDFIDEIILRNTAPFPQVFEFRTNLDRAFLSFDQITLMANQEIIIPILLTASCNEKPGSVEYDVFIRSTTGVEQVISRSLEIKKCQTISAQLFADKNVSDICAPVNYSILLRNPATFTEDYLIGPLDNVDFFDEVGYSVSLNPGQVSFLNFTFTPSCDVSGNVSNKFRIKASSSLSAELSHSLFIEPGYDFSLVGPESLELCKQEIVEQTYTITNNGLVANTYDIRLSNKPSFVSLSNDLLHLEPSESATFNLVFEPGFKLRNNYDFNLFVETRIGDFEASKDVSLSLIDCFDTKFSILSPPDLSVCQGSQILHVQLINNGLFDETYILETNTHRAYFVNSSVTLAPGEEVVLNLIVDSSEFSGKILFEVYAFSEKNLLINWKDSIVLDVVPLQDCSKIQFPGRYVIYSRYYEDVVILSVKNNGIRDNTFNVSYDGSDFLELVDDSIFIEAGAYHDIVLNKTREHEQDNYFFTLTLTSDDGIHYVKEFKLVLTGTPLFQEIRDYAVQNPCFLFALIILTLLILVSVIYLISGPFMGRTVKLSFVVLLILFVIVLFIINGLPQKVNPSLLQPDDPYAHRIYEGDELVIDLSKFIVDPDGDTLIFEVVDGPDHLNYTLFENMSLLTINSANFTGSDRFRVLARDELGGEVVTPRFMIEVVERTQLSSIEWYELYCVYFNIALLFVFALFLFLFKDKPKTIEEKQKKKETRSISKKSSAKKVSSKNKSSKASSKKSSAKKVSSKNKSSKKSLVKKPVSKKKK